MFEPDDSLVCEISWNSHRNWADLNYLRLVDDVLKNGVLKPTRAKINGKNISAYSVFGRQARFSLAEGFPILTTKKVNFNAIAHELIWFLSGSSNIQYLKDNNIHIWDQWADESGDLGYGTYGTLWRSFPFHSFDQCPDEDHCLNSFANIDKYNDPEGRKNWPVMTHRCYESDVDGSIDQIKLLIQNIEKVKSDPTASCGRRLIVTAWHPFYVESVGLPPCHCFMQFNVTGDKLSCMLYQRSADLFLGVPFNISSYALLTHIIANLTGLQVGEFIHTYGDLHIYENHIDQLKQQMDRRPYKLPTLAISRRMDMNINNLTRDDFELLDYQHHPYLKGEVAV